MSRHGRNSRRVRGHPGRPLRHRVGLIWLVEERVQGDPRGPGGPPYSSGRSELQLLTYFVVSLNY
jgi:hypothetical protein